MYKLDRLTRSVIDTYKLLYELQEHNCQLIAVIDQLDINSANGRMIVGILAVFAQWEREVIQERTLDGLQAMVNQGKYLMHIHLLDGIRIKISFCLLMSLRQMLLMI